MGEKTDLNYDEIELDFPRIFRAVWKRMWLVLLSAVLAAVLVCGGVRLLWEPQYSADVLFYVASDASREGVSSGGLTASRDLVESCRILLFTRESLESIIDRTGVDDTGDTLKTRITAEAVGETEYLCVTVCDAEPGMAVALAEAVGHILPERAAQVMPGVTIHLADRAVRPTQPDANGGARLALLGLLAGAALAVVWIAAGVIFDPMVRTKADVARVCGCPVLACVPGEERLLRTKLLHSGCAIVGVAPVGEHADMGRTAAQLANAMADSGQTILALPPMDRPNDAIPAAAGTRGVILEIVPGRCRRTELADAIQELASVDVPVIGTILYNPGKTKQTEE